MRMTAIHAQTEPKRLDRFARHAEKQGRQARTGWLHRRFRPDPSDRATEDASRGKKHLSSGQVQAIFTSNRLTFVECQLTCAVIRIGMRK